MHFPAPPGLPQARNGKRESARLIERHPLDYYPSSNTLVNTARLPPVEELRRTELGFREVIEDEADLCRAVDREVLRFVLMASTVALLIPFVGAVIPFTVVLVALVVLGVLWALKRFLFSTERSVWSLFSALVIPLIVAAVSYLIAFLLSYRPAAALLLSCLSLSLMILVTSDGHPVKFYLDWVYTAPHLKPVSRRKRKRVLWRSLLFFFCILSIAVMNVLFVVAAYSPSITLAILFFAGLTLNLFNPVRSYVLARKILAQYLTYTGQESGAPGLWIPKTSLRRRRWVVAAVIFLFYLSLSTGLCLYFPADLIAVNRVTKREWKGVELKRPSASQGLQQNEFGVLSSPDKALPSVEQTQKQELSKQSPPLPPLPLLEPRKSEAIGEALKNYFSFESVRKEYSKGGERGFLSFLFALGVNRNSDTQEGARSFIRGLWQTWDMKASGLFYFFVLPVVFALVIPNVLLLGMFRLILSRAEAERQEVESKDRDARTEWQCYVDRVIASKHELVDPLGNKVKEAEHLFLGVEPHYQFPILLDKKILSEHCYIVGQTGSGKTALGMMPLFLQLIRGRSGEQLPDADRHPIVIIDLKGDPAFFHTAREEAREQKREFKFFTLEKDKATDFFDPFAAFGTKERTITEVCQLFLESLGLNHGQFYGGSYFSRQSRLLLQDTLKEKSPKTFKELYDDARELMRKRPTYYRDCYELLATIHALTEYKQLTLQGNPPEKAIDMRKVIRERQIVYFWLPAAVEAMSVNEVAKLALFALITAARDVRQAEGPCREKVQTYLFIDEFQRIASQNFRIVLEQARSFGVGTILANQSISDLQTPDIDLRPTIRTNTRLQLYFSVTDPKEVAALSEMSGEELSLTASMSMSEGFVMDKGLKGLVRQSSESTSLVEQIKFRFTRNDIARVSDHPFDFFAHVTRGSGYTQFGGLPIPVRTSWPLSTEIYDHRANDESWPKATPQQVISETTPQQKDHKSRIRFNNDVIEKILLEEVAAETTMSGVLTSPAPSAKIRQRKNNSDQE